MKSLRKRLNFSNVVACIALFVALGGASYAAVNLPKNSVGTKQLKKKAVTTAKIKGAAVTTGKLKPGSVTEGRLADGAVTTGKIADGAILSAKLGDGAVNQQKLGPESVGSPQLKGISTVSETSVSTADGVSTGVTATCPAGTAIAGGFETQNVGAAKWLVKRLVRTGNGYRVFGTNESGGNSTITAFAYCLNE